MELVWSSQSPVRQMNNITVPQKSVNVNQSMCRIGMERANPGAQLAKFGKMESALSNVPLMKSSML
jgi:hypothetical protein